MSLGTAYLYNTETNGGNYKHVVASATPASSLDVEEVTMYTAAAVHAREGTVLLRTARNTHESGLDGSGRYPVAVYDEDDNAILLGDSSFLEADRFNVGENEEFAAFLVEFLISGEHVDGSADEPAVGTDTETADAGEGEGDTGEDDDGTGTVNGTATPAPMTPAASVDVPVSPSAA
jgi:hypothetical protein